MKLSLVIPAKDKNDPKLQELIRSIEAQDFPRREMETLIITEGTSESAKAIGIRAAKGEVIGILASDNEFVNYNALTEAYRCVSVHGNRFSFRRYHHSPSDDILNRYFALMGCNDPLAYYMYKNDKDDYFHPGLEEKSTHHTSVNGTLGDNGFFCLKKSLEKTDLDNYYHIENALETEGMLVQFGTIWHKTGGNIFKFFAKRYRYGLQHAFNKNRRWHLVDFRQPKDILRFLWFIICGMTFVEPLFLSIRGYLKLKDPAWFLHPLACLMTVFTYGLLMLHLLVRRLSQSLSAPMTARIV